MKPKKQATSVTSFAKKHADPPKYSKRQTSKTELDYYEDYPHLIPPYALNNYAKQIAYEQVFHSPYGIHVPGSNMIIPHGSMPGNMTNMAYGGHLLAPLAFPYNNKKKAFQQPTPLPAYGFVGSQDNSYLKKLKPTKSNTELFQTNQPILSQLYQNTKSVDHLNKDKSKSNEKIHKTVTYKLDQIEEIDTQRSDNEGNDTASEHEHEDSAIEREEVETIHIKKPVFNPSILKKVDRSDLHNDSREFMRSESNENRRTQSKEMLRPSDIFLEPPKPLTLRLDQEIEMEKAEKMRRRNEFSQMTRYRAFNDSKEKNLSSLKDYTDKPNNKPLTLKIDQDVENDRLEKIRRRKEFSQLVRSLDVLPKIQKKQESSVHPNNNPSVHALRRNIANSLQAHSHDFPNQKLGENQFDRFIELRKMQYINVGHVSRDLFRSEHETRFVDTSDPYFGKTLYIPNKN